MTALEVQSFTKRLTRSAIVVPDAGGKLRDFREENWKRSMGKDIQPIEIGKTMIINLRGVRTIIEISGSSYRSIRRCRSAQGTTNTRLVLMMLEGYITPSCSVLDVARHGRFLAIASVKLGAGVGRRGRYGRLSISNAN